jgi:hypothetical protein
LGLKQKTRRRKSSTTRKKRVLKKPRYDTKRDVSRRLTSAEQKIIKNRPEQVGKLLRKEEVIVAKTSLEIVQDLFNRVGANKAILFKEYDRLEDNTEMDEEWKSRERNKLIGKIQGLSIASELLLEALKDTI